MQFGLLFLYQFDFTKWIILSYIKNYSKKKWNQVHNTHQPCALHILLINISFPLL